MRKENQLTRTINLMTGFSALVGTVIGAGIFFKPTAVFASTQDATLGLLAWIISGCIAIAGGMTVAELGVLFPETGGIIVYLEKVYGKIIAFLAGWVQMIVYFPGNIAALGIIFATQFIALFNLSATLITPIAMMAVIFVMGINLLGNQYSGKVQNIFTVLKFVPLLLIVMAGFLQPDHTIAFDLSAVIVNKDNSVLSKLGAGVLATMFAYDGWLNIGNLAGEIKKPHKNIPKVILFGVGLVTAIYILVNIAYLMVATPQELAATVTPAAFVADRLFGGIGGKIVTVGILVSVFGGLNGYTMSAIRVPYALAKKEWLPFSHHIQKLNVRTHTSLCSGVIILIMVLLLMNTGTFDSLTNLVIVTMYLFTVLIFVEVIILRFRLPDEPRAYKVPFYPIVPIIATLGGGFIVVNTLLLEPLNVLYGILLTLCGLPIYWFSTKISKNNNTISHVENQFFD